MYEGKIPSLRQVLLNSKLHLCLITLSGDFITDGLLTLWWKSGTHRSHRHGFPNLPTSIRAWSTESSLVRKRKSLSRWSIFDKKNQPFNWGDPGVVASVTLSNAFISSTKVSFFFVSAFSKSSFSFSSNFFWFCSSFACTCAEAKLSTAMAKKTLRRVSEGQEVKDRNIHQFSRLKKNEEMKLIRDISLSEPI